MTTMLVTELEHHWPEAAKALAVEKVVILTRDGIPVAKMTVIEAPQEPRKRYDFDEHRKWKEEVFGIGTVFEGVAEQLEIDREDRF